MSLGLPLLRTDNEVQVKEQAQVQARLDAEKKKAREKSRKETAEKIKEAKLLAPSKGSVRSSTTTSLGAASKKDADIDDAMVSFVVKDDPCLFTNNGMIPGYRRGPPNLERNRSRRRNE